MHCVTVQEAINLAIEHQNAGRLHDAEKLYRQVLAVAPDHPEALHWLGVIAMHCGALDPARQLIARSLEVSPNYPEAQCSMGDVLSSLGNPVESVEWYRRALEARPGFVEAINNLGTVLAELGRRDEAMAEYRKAQQLLPNSPQPWGNMSQALLDEGRTDEAIDAAREAIARDAQFADAHNNLGAGLLRMGLFDQALSSFRHAVELRSDFPLARSNLGMAELLTGDFENGWRDYEWRVRLPTSYQFLPGSSQPKWNGEDLSGATILLHAEQGYGDVIQFSRYIPMVAQRGGRIIVGCHAPLKRLVSRMSGVAQCVTNEETIPDFDVYCPLMSLPGVFGTRPDSIPANIPYIQADPVIAQRWQDRLAGESRRKVGLVWAGRAEHTNDRNRSLPLESFSPLLGIESIRWISLQKGDPAAQAQSCGFDLTDWTVELSDFEDTAGLIDALGLVICVDTAVAHLAAALGKPVWLLLPFVPDWRWLLDRDDSPWYPTMRLFRQPAAGDWDSVIRRIGSELQAEGNK